MAVIKNVIKSLFTSEGADRVESDFHKLTRAQTRLSGASVSAGRQFAAQASGMGGLVAAYAGAAATTFAISAAFDALAKSARADQTIQGVNTLAAGIAQSGSQILKSVQEITHGQITLAQVAEQTNLALSAGFSTKQIESLASVSLKASRALGRDLTDSMTRVTRGSAKMEAELLDELGIYTKIEPATRAYAAAIGKNVTALSDYERRQAFVNAVISEGQRKYAAINTVIPTSAEKIEKLGATLTNMATSLGAFLADVLSPLAGGLTDNIAASFAAMGLVISLVASKGVQVFSESVKHLVENMNHSLRIGENWMRAKLKMTEVVLAATEANKKLEASILRVSDAEKASFGKIQGAASGRQLTRKELQQSTKILSSNLSLLRAEETQLQNNRKELRNAYVDKLKDARIATAAYKTAEESRKAAQSVVVRGGIQSQAARDKAKNVRNAFAAERAAQAAAASASATAAAERARVTPLLAQNTEAAIANSAAITANTTAINANRAASVGWRASLSALAMSISTPFINAVGNIGKTIGMVTGFVSKAFFWVSIIQLVGSALASAFGKADEYNAFFSELGNTITTFISGSKAKATKNTILGVVSGALGDLEQVDKTLRDTETFSFKKKSFLGVDIRIEKTKEQLVQEVSSMLVDAGESGGKSFWESLASGAAASGGIIGAAIGGPIGAAAGVAIGAAIDYFFLSSDSADALAAKYGDSLRTKFSTQLAKLPEDTRDTAIKALAQIEDTYGSKALFDPAARSAKELQENLVFASVEALRTVEAIQQVSSATAKSSAEVNKSFDFSTAKDGIEGISSSLSYVSEAITTIGNKKLRFLFIDDMNQQLQDLLNTKFFTGETFKQLDLKALNDFSGMNLDAEGLRSYLDMMQQNILRWKKEGFDAVSILSNFNISGDPIPQAILNQLVNSGAAKDLEDAINKINSSSITLADSYYVLSGAINEVQQKAVSAASVLKDTNDEFARGTLTLERFSQNTSNVKNALVEASRSLPGIQSKLAELKLNVEATKESGTPKEVADAQALLATEQTRYINVQSVIEANKELLNVLVGQESTMKRQIELQQFFKEQSKNLMPDIELQFELAKAGAENAKLASANYFKGLVTDYSAASKAAQSYQDSIKNSSIIDSGLNDAEKALLMTASTGNIEQVKNMLSDVDSSVISFGNNVVTIGQGIHAQTINLVDQASQEALTIVEGSKDALTKLGQDALIAAVGMAKDFNTKVTEEIKGINQQIADLTTKDNIAQVRFELDRLAIKEQGQQAALEFEKAFRENQIKLIELQVDNKKLKPTEGAKQINALKTEIQGLQEAALQVQREMMAERWAKESELQWKEYQATRDKIRLEGEQLKQKYTNEYNVLRDTAKIYTDISGVMSKTLVDAGNSIGQSVVTSANTAATTLASVFGPLGKLMGFGTGVQVGTYTPQQVPSQKTVSTSAGGVDAFVASLSPLDKALLGAEANMRALTDSVDKGVSAQLEGAQKEHQRTLQLQADKRSLELAELERQGKLTAQERKILEEENTKRLNEAGKAEETVSALQEKLKALFDSIKGNIENALVSLNNLVLYGEGTFGEIAGNFFKTMQQDFFKTAIANPLSTSLTEGLFKLGGVNTTLGADNATVKFTAEGRALLVSMVGGASGFFPNITDKTKTPGSPGATDLATDPTKGFFGNMFNQISGFFTNLFGQGGIVSNLFSGLFGQGGILSGLFKGILGLFGFGMAQGGAVHLAQGGAAISSVMNRDRVPAMLEPGEFVLRKQAVRSVGLPNVQAMNATGAAPTGAPVINISNQGSPKDVQSAQPRFDGEKYVIDIVMRDFANNGPIRRSLRSNKGGL